MSADVFYSPDLTAMEDRTLRRLSGPLLVATNCTSLIWLVVEVVEYEIQRRYLQLRSRFDPITCFIELTPNDLEGMDVETLKRMIVGNEKPCRHNPS